jgi:hypothetical protein
MRAIVMLFRLRRWASPKALWMPLARVEFVEKSATHTVQHAALQVELVGGRRISVSSGFDAASLTRLIVVLEQA